MPSLRSEGAVAEAAADIREPDQIAAALDAIEGQLGTPTVLINNAAANFPVLAASMRPERNPFGHQHRHGRHVLL